MRLALFLGANDCAMQGFLKDTKAEMAIFFVSNHLTKS
jgi:hypothetical protein